MTEPTNALERALDKWLGPPEPWEVGEWLRYADGEETMPGHQHMAQVVAVNEDGSLNLRVYLDSSDSMGETSRWFTWAHGVELREQ